MLIYVLRRLGWSAVTMALLVCATFFVIRNVPGDAAADFVNGGTASDNLRANLGLSGSVTEQFTTWLGRLLRGDLGESQVFRGQQVSDLIADGIATTAPIAAVAIAVSLALGIGLATLDAGRRATRRMPSQVVAMLGVAIPIFVVAPVLSLVFGVWLDVLPSGGYRVGSPRHLVLPVLSLTLPLTATVFLLCREAIAETLAQPFVRTARAKGATRRGTVAGHALRVAMIPTLSVLGPLVVGTVLGSVVVEIVFDIPGLGRLFINAMTDRDYPVIMGATVVVAGLIVVTNLLIDLAYPLIDPRLRARREPT